jgi:hypothetical protein
MAFLIIVLIIFVIFVASKSQSNTINSNCARMKEQGVFLETDYNRHRILFQDFYQDWFLGDKENFPKEYWKYFLRNKDAVLEYISALTSSQEIKEGLQPVWCIGIYNKFTYDPFRRFHNMYDEKIKTYNETGTYYW